MYLLLKKQNPFWSNNFIHARPSLGLAWIGGACLSETVASNKVIISEQVLFLDLKGNWAAGMQYLGHAIEGCCNSDCMLLVSINKPSAVPSQGCLALPFFHCTAASMQVMELFQYIIFCEGKLRSAKEEDDLNCYKNYYVIIIRIITLL